MNASRLHNLLMKFKNSSLPGEEGEVRSVLQEQSTALGLGMFALMVQRCTELLKQTPAGAYVVNSTPNILINRNF